ncbi:MAG: rhodanese-like domain-containing protein [Leeuwenhoekiella sp.]
MKIVVLTFGFFLLCFSAEAQRDIDALISQYNKGSVPYISVEELKMEPDSYLILDTRKKKEYEVSHLPGAIWAGEKPDEGQLAKLAEVPEKPIVVYCSVGIRSEGFGEKLQKMGYTNVRNLYGSIFSWKDAGFHVVDSTQTATDRVHVFGKVWGKYLETGDKVYESP